MAEIFEYRGVEGLVFAEVLTDDNDSDGSSGYTTGTVKPLAGVAEIGKTTENSSESHYYDNIPAVVIQSEGSDTITLSVSGVPLDVLAEITGKKYDSTKGAMVDIIGTPKYFAIGYKTKKTNGEEVYVWRYKGKFGTPDETYTTENDGTDANGMELTYTGIATTHKFTNGGRAKGLVVDTGLDLADVSTFFDSVTTPDTLTVKAEE